MKVTGIDPDSRAITYAVLTNGELTHDRIEAEGRRAEDRYLHLITSFQEHLNYRWASILESDWVYLEKPMVGPNRKAAIDLGMVVGAIRANLVVYNLSHSLVDPGVWKKNLLGNGKASKEEIKAWVLAAHSIPDNLAQDYYDATAIAHFGVQAFGK